MSVQVFGPNFLRPFAGLEELRTFAAVDPPAPDYRAAIAELEEALAQVELTGEATIRRPDWA